MEKFLCYYKLSKATTFIGWLKLIISIILICFIFAGLVFSDAIGKTLKSGYKISSKDLDSKSKFFAFGIFSILGLVVNAAVCFILILGSINHDRINVMCFLVIDALATVVISYMFYVTFFSFTCLLILVAQFYLIYTVFSYWLQLQKEFRSREENRDKRSRRPMNLGFVRASQDAFIASTEIV